jgi:hypothetical protein
VLANNAGYPNKQIIATNTYNMYANSDYPGYPLDLYDIGYVFGYLVYSYILQNFAANGYFPFPPQFTIEAWVKMGSTT